MLLDKIRTRGIIPVLREKVEVVRTNGFIPTIRDRVEEITISLKERVYGSKNVNLTREEPISHKINTTTTNIQKTRETTRYTLRRGF